MNVVCVLCHQARKSLKNVDWDVFYAADEQEAAGEGNPAGEAGEGTADEGFYDEFYRKAEEVQAKMPPKEKAAEEVPQEEAAEEMSEEEAGEETSEEAVEN